MSSVIDLEQGTAEWLAARLGRVTASRVCDVIAKTKTGYSTSRAQYMTELVCERLTGKPAADVYVNADMQRGTDLEPIARALYEVTRDKSVQQVGFVPHPTLEWAGASPDGLVDHDGLTEIKAPRPHVHLDYLETGKPPTKYQPQMAWQCICTGRVWCDFVSYCEVMPDDLQLFVVRYTPEPGYLQEIEAEVRKFLDETEARLTKVQQLRRGV
jgi:putative phage-type endonuclease